MTKRRRKEVVSRLTKMGPAAKALCWWGSWLVAKLLCMVVSRTRPQEQQASTSEAAKQAVLNWWWDAHDKHVGYMARGRRLWVSDWQKNEPHDCRVATSHREAAEGVSEICSRGGQLGSL
jgi:hypothetical protein